MILYLFTFNLGDVNKKFENISLGVIDRHWV
jgi:hypothetical protein